MSNKYHYIKIFKEKHTIKWELEVNIFYFSCSKSGRINTDKWLSECVKYFYEKWSVMQTTETTRKQVHKRTICNKKSFPITQNIANIAFKILDFEVIIKYFVLW